MEEFENENTGGYGNDGNKDIADERHAAAVSEAVPAAAEGSGTGEEAVMPGRTGAAAVNEETVSESPAASETMPETEYGREEAVTGAAAANADTAAQQEGYYSYGTAAGSEPYMQNAQNGGNGYAWQQVYAEPQMPKKQGGGFAVKLLKGAAMAVTFGLIAGLSFAGSTYLFGKIAGNTAEEVSDEDEEALSGADLHIAETTEALDTIASRTDDGTKQMAEGGVTDVSDIVDQAMPSIVSITTIARTQVPSFFFGYEEYESEGCGSGIIISQDEENIYIATNNHVIEGAQTLTVVFDDGSSVNAKIKGADASSDLAVVAVKLSDIEEETKQKIRLATFGDSEQLKIGQTAIAIGNALGYGQSVTTGVISALDREVTVMNETDGSTITNELLQTSAAINPGNSGGALLNANGEVIGITSVKYAETSVEGMGYAIPSETAIPIIRQLITRELVKGSDSAYFGISGVDVTQAVSETYHMPQGVYIAQIVEGSSAADAGLMQGDIITRFDGRNIKSMEEMQDLLQYLSAGTEVEVTIQRAQNGEYVEQTITVTLGSKN